MTETSSNGRKYLFTLAIGVIAGGIIVAWATKLMPKMMSGMMQNMMAHMGGEGCSPAEM